ncbi:glycosyltransferase family 2 protein [Enterococcus faecium]|uniref:glycosyltransferase family 2 protein n=1 Tax=Enterococcus faecium TaxID=1352 RepID=UPI00288EB447|nr:glycosyltransferase family 2 protein [Enterococcus faecium]MDT2348128.1 glycosyltransferase family 2 protein [Enterococcus faecium]MDW3721122.1 glycosyltransferase family 2 protein [Enterococcus faecium]
MKLVSCVITTVNREKKLIRAISSCINQVYTNIEIIVVIDGENPDLATSLRTHFEKIKCPLQIIETGDRVGGNEARNIGISKSNGYFVALLDDDDEWLPNKIEEQVKMFNDNKDCVVFCSVYRIDSDVKKKILPRKSYKSTMTITKFLFDTTKLGLRAGFIQTSTLFSTKEIFSKINFDPELKKHQDWDWCIKVASNGINFVHINKPLVYYHNEHTKNRVGRDKDYIASFKWLNSVKNYLTKREYDRFIYSVIIPMIREDKSLSKSQKKEITKKYAQSIALRNKFHFGYIVENLKPLYLNFSNKE